MIDRRSFLAASTATMLTAAAPAAVRGVRTESFPSGFLWGAATAGHQVEGNNVNSDQWVLENVVADPAA